VSGSLVENRSAATEVLDVDGRQRVVTCIVVPWGEAAVVPFKGDLWEEVFSRNAFDTHANSGVRVNRGHDKQRTVGKVVNRRNDERGHIADVRIAETSLGDETLTLAEEDCLSVSAGFFVLPHGEILNRGKRTRTITRAALDHISFVESPAYSGSRVLAVRNQHVADNLTIDNFLDDPIFKWADRHLRRLGK